MVNYTSPCPTVDAPTKRCSKCRIEYPASSEHFYHHKRSKDGFYPQCKSCKDSYRQTPKGREVTKRKVNKWRKTEKGTAFVREKLRRRKDDIDPLKLSARQSVNYAVHTGKLQPIKSCTCQICGKQAEEYHHWSYEPEHWLDVIPLCQPCHTKLHATD